MALRLDEELYKIMSSPNENKKVTKNKETREALSPKCQSMCDKFSRFPKFDGGKLIKFGTEKQMRNLDWNEFFDSLEEEKTPIIGKMKKITLDLMEKIGVKLAKKQYQVYKIKELFEEYSKKKMLQKGVNHLSDKMLEDETADLFMKIIARKDIESGVLFEGNKIINKIILEIAESRSKGGEIKNIHEQKARDLLRNMIIVEINKIDVDEQGY